MKCQLPSATAHQEYTCEARWVDYLLQQEEHTSGGMISSVCQKEAFIGFELFLGDLREGLRQQGFAQIRYYQKIGKSRICCGWHSVTLLLSVLKIVK